MADTKTDSGKEGATLDKILSHLDGINKRMDSMEEGMADSRKRVDAACERMDAADKARADAEEQTKEQERADAEAKEAKVKADAAAEEEDKADKARKDAEKEEEGKKAKADAARADSNSDLHAKIADLQKRIPVELAEADRALFVDAQSKAERVAQAFGDSAPRWVSGETLTQYRQRLLGKFKSHSKAWKDADLRDFKDSALDTVETQVYADAWQAAIRPANVEGGMLREVTENDRTGRKITRFYGDPEACWGPFKQPARHVTGWNTKFN